MALNAASPARRAFAEVVRRADAQVNLAQAALLVAQEEYPGLDPATHLARLDAIAGHVATYLVAHGTPRGRADAHTVIAALNAVLFGDLGFHGNRFFYYDPRNSFLNEVLDRRTGIPITLALVYMEVAARLELPLAGIGTPGHFIVQYAGSGAGHGPHADELFIDPYEEGVLLTRAECAEHFRRIYGPDFRFSPEYLAPLTRHQILARLLGNLKTIYLKQNDVERALMVVDRLVLVQPDALWERKDRGLLHFQLGAFQPALEDLQAYLQGDPDAEDATQIAYTVQQCQYLLQSRN
jgi:regulator of sirC expression with transglutaminase-like and TPR domain